MMRSLYSGVAGLKTHQTRMDVIGNNIANVNTVAYKSMSMTFTELMYQTTQKASGPNAATGRAGTNARQIGLGSVTGAISTQITTAGSTQTTGNAFDVKINGNSFFIVSDNGTAGNAKFTRDGSFYVDALGNLAMSSNGYNVMGWQVDENTGDIKQDTVTALRIMSAANLSYEPEATTEAYIAGILDKNDSNVQSKLGKSISLGFYDSLGYQYTAKLSIHATTNEGTYYVELDDVLDVDGNSITEQYGNCDISDIVTFGGVDAIQTVSVNELSASKFNFSIVNETAVSHTWNTVNGDDETELEDLQKAIDEYFKADDVTSITGQSTYLINKYYSAADQAVLQQLKTENQDAYDNGFVTFTVGTTTSTLGSIIMGTGRITTANATSADYADGSNDNYMKLQEIQDLWNYVQESKAEGTTATLTLLEAQGKEADKLIADQIIASREDYPLYKLEQLYPSVDFTNVLAGKIDEEGNFVITSKNINGGLLKYNTDTGEFISIATNAAGQDTGVLNFKDSIVVNNETVSLNNFADIEVDFSPSTMYNNSGTSTLSATKGDVNGLGTGRMLGTMDGVAIQQDGKIYASYTNGCTRLLGQIAVAEFSNASGLEKMGDNLYAATLNSGDFDGVGIDITSNEGSMTTGALEMSNVDLASEFTEMITTQRGYQANSRIITVSDTLLEELVNLKR